MDVAQIKAFIDAMAASDLDRLEAAKDGWTLRLFRHGAVPAEAPPGVAAPPPEPRPQARPSAPPEIRAPLGGVVHLQPAPGAPPFVAEGDAVVAGAVVCVVEAMKLFNEVRAERAGTIAAVLVASGDEVAPGQALFRLRG